MKYKAIIVNHAGTRHLIAGPARTENDLKRRSRHDAQPGRIIASVRSGSRVPPRWMTAARDEINRRKPDSILACELIASIEHANIERKTGRKYARKLV